VLSAWTVFVMPSRTEMHSVALLTGLKLKDAAGSYRAMAHQVSLAVAAW
jgi:hypothetical protein